MTERIDYDEFAYFADNAAEYGIAFSPPDVRRTDVALDDDHARWVSALAWGTATPDLVLVHGGAQNAHTWDTVALALDRPLVAVDLPGHGHSGPPQRAAGAARADALAVDVAVAVEQLATTPATLVGMSLGGLTSIALTAARPELVSRLVLVDITPAVTAGKAKAITDFVRGPATFDSFDELLARTIEYNPTRSESSLRRGILHNAEQLADGTWRWRYRRFDEAATGADAGPMPERDLDLDRSTGFVALWDQLGGIEVPVLLVRGMADGSVVDDADEAELRRRLPTAQVAHVDGAGHSVQGDRPVELATLIADFIAA